MVQVIINKEKCTGCGICAEICPYRAIILSRERAEYIIEECFLCGQCQAVCPVSAIELLNIPTKLGLTTIKEREDATPPGTTNVSELVALMRSRRSCRKYQNKAVDRAVLDDLVKIGTTAPSGTNSQSWNFIIVPERSDLLILGGRVADYYRKLNRLAENSFLRFIVRIISGDSLGQYYRRYYQSVSESLREWDEEGTDRLFHGASAAILVTGNKQASCPAEDALLATQNILLAAHAMGLGSCLIGFVVEALRLDSKLRRLVGITEDMEIYSTIALGYPAIKYYRPANRKIVVPRIFNSRKTDFD